VYAFEPLDLTHPHRPTPHDTDAIISHYPLKPIQQATEEPGAPRNIGASTAVTDGVEVVACPVFVPERSSLGR
jgi:hypothetical protein